MKILLVTICLYCLSGISLSTNALPKEATASICKPFKENSEKCSLILNLRELLQDCGQVCNTTIKAKGQGLYYDVIQKDFDCINLFESSSIDSRSLESTTEVKKPMSFMDLPKRIKYLYSYEGRVAVRDLYMNDANGGGDPIVWTIQQINQMRIAVRQGRPQCGYGTAAALEVQRHLQDQMRQTVTGGHILVIGSQTPWIEAILLELGASKITTVDYTPIECQHPNIETITPEELSKRFLQDPNLLYDGVVTFSSVEHSGLGRYGDALNPWGDLITMAKAWCVTRPGGRLLLAVPTGYDSVYFNTHKIYGPIQFSHLFANWNVVYTEASMFKDGIRTKDKDLPCNPGFMCYQPVHILEKETIP